jgi:hypothetical protein
MLAVDVKNIKKTFTSKQDTVEAVKTWPQWSWKINNYLNADNTPQHYKGKRINIRY